MDRLSLLFSIMTGAVLTGALVITSFSLGFYSWPAILGSAIIGFVLSWPFAYLLSRRTKRRDPNWDHTRADRTDAVPRPAEPEV